MDTRLYIGNDHAGYELKTRLLERLMGEFPQFHFEDCGPQSSDSVDYPIYAQKVANLVLKHDGVGILICGTGIGMSIAANKVAGIRAAVVWDVTSARLARLHNGANVLCLGARLLGDEVGFEAACTFLQTPFEGGRHAKRLDLIQKMEETS